jgi:hypothetical protein
MNTPGRQIRDGIVDLIESVTPGVTGIPDLSTIQWSR